MKPEVLSTLTSLNDKDNNLNIKHPKKDKRNAFLSLGASCVGSALFGTFSVTTLLQHKEPLHVSGIILAISIAFAIAGGLQITTLKKLYNY